MQHSWFKSLPYRKVYGLEADKKVRVKQGVARMTADMMGVTYGAVKSTVEDNDHNKYTTL